MEVITKKYSEERVRDIYQLLVNVMKNSHPKEYDLRIDEMKVISRTRDPECLLTCKDFVTQETKNIRINIFEGTSNRRIQYMLVVKEDDFGSEYLSGDNALLLQKNEKGIDSSYIRLNKKIEDLTKKLDKTNQNFIDLEEQVKQMPVRNADVDKTINFLVHWYFNEMAIQRAKEAREIKKQIRLRSVFL